MVTKTLTIMEDAYKLLADRKLENESFSEEIRRLFSKTQPKNLMDFFGIISDEEGEAILKDLKEIDAQEIELIKKGLE